MHHQIVIIGGGAGGIGLAASLLKRNATLDIAIIEPSETHSYQPAWTLVGGGAFDYSKSQRSTQSVMPKGVKWIKDAVSKVDPKHNKVVLSDGSEVSYQFLALSPGLTLNWGAIKGLEETLGKNGVTSNYQEGLSKYTWELVRNLKGGKAIFSQPPMPIKCAGAPQKAMYMSCSAWQKAGVLKDISVDFCNAGGVLFGVADYVPALMEYVEEYGINLNFEENLIAVDGKKKIATFATKDGNVDRAFDMLHVVPPQVGMGFLKDSGLVNEGNWIEVDQNTLQSVHFDNVFGLGDATTTPNAKTAAATRKQVVVAAENMIAAIEGKDLKSAYDGYGSCPLTVANGKIVLAEFAYGGKVAPTFPVAFLNGKTATRRAWFLKKTMLPWIYWNQMLKGTEWFAGSDDISKYK